MFKIIRNRIVFLTLTGLILGSAPAAAVKEEQKRCAKVSVLISASVMTALLVPLILSAGDFPFQKELYCPGSAGAWCCNQTSAVNVTSTDCQHYPLATATCPPPSGMYCADNTNAKVRNQAWVHTAVIASGVFFALAGLATYVSAAVLCSAYSSGP